MLQCRPIWIWCQYVKSLDLLGAREYNSTRWPDLFVTVVNGMGLEEYRRKRQFALTPEPAGGEKNDGETRFVIHRHQARHLHYDFRLEMEGVLRSWAVPKGVPLESGVRRLAVSVEDHPIEYLDFAGTIPEGEYGAGTVEVWDRGTFKVNRNEADLLEFTLKGEKLSGGYVLIHTDGKNWLLVKRKEQPR